jgi:hypothetical protein
MLGGGYHLGPMCSNYQPVTRMDRMLTLVAIALDDEELNPDELDPPMRGDLIVKVDRDRLDGLVVREASLIVYTGLSGTPRSILPRLVDARMVEIEGVTLTLIGIEQDPAANDRGPEHVQVWRCTLLAVRVPDQEYGRFADEVDVRGPPPNRSRPL